MPRPNGLKTKIFLDSGDPSETEKALSVLGFLDGQTTNPSLIAKNPAAQRRVSEGKKFSGDEVNAFYLEQVKAVSALIPDGSVSIEVYADHRTGADDMLTQAEDMFSWIPNAHIKFPTTASGLEAAEHAVRKGIRVNMTLVFSQEQAAAVYAATVGAQKGDVFVSPFAGRLDDKGENGMDLIKNIGTMFSDSDGHVEVLGASIRNLDHLFYAIQTETDIVTVPFSILEEWGRAGMALPDASFHYRPDGLAPIMYEAIDLHKDWRAYDVAHDLTNVGLEKFAADWRSIVETSG